MRSLDPRAIAIIELGAEGDNCVVAKCKTKWLQSKVLVVNSIFLALVSLVAVFQCLGFLLSYLRIEKHLVSRQSDSNLIPQKLTLIGG